MEPAPHNAEMFEQMWRRITLLAGQGFVTKTGKPFTFYTTPSAVGLQNTNRVLPRSHFERAVLRFPVSGPGALQDLQGPSYLWAILSDPRVRDGSTTTTGVSTDHPHVSRLPARAKPTTPLAPAAAQPADLTKPGRQMHRDELAADGFTSFTLCFHPPTSDGFHDWDILGPVPDAPGLYAFTLSSDDSDKAINVMYVGMTKHLWMVTNGKLPSGTPRPGQRYGRPKWAGATRVRINANIALAHGHGLHVEHWLRPVPTTLIGDELSHHLRVLEEQLITSWRLRAVGWNRGIQPHRATCGAATQYNSCDPVSGESVDPHRP